MKSRISLIPRNSIPYIMHNQGNNNKLRKLQNNTTKRALMKRIELMCHLLANPESNSEKEVIQRTKLENCRSSFSSFL